MNREVRLLFHELAGIPAEQRARILSERSLAPELRAEVESLLHYDSPEGSAFGWCVAEAAEETLRSSPLEPANHCGPYRLVRLLGRGGMGSVYLGERIDGEIQQRVAVKLLAAGERPEWRERFLAERQLLASIHHPSIVHAIDAGHTDDGRPFLVMEYVEGLPIDVYAANIGARDRLKLFVRVCEAVAHAHARLIIHRDLKPSNILVDESGQPKLLDFGIAKLLDGTAQRTCTREQLLTPGYASPEQLRGSVQTTATDIYSMGAVLFRLLTGRMPNDQVAGGSRYAESIRPSQLDPELPGDVDYIVRKALRAEPDERYASMEAFANDVRAALESRPVTARSGDAWYRGRRLLRRHWVPAAVATIVTASLTAGLYIANRERAVAEKRFGQLQRLSGRVFDLDKAIRNLPGSTRARQSLVAASLEYLEGLTADARGDPDLVREIGEGYWRIGRVQGVPTEPNLGDPAKAEVSLAKADGLIDSVLARRPNDKAALLRSAAVAQDRMILAQEVHRNSEAVAFAKKAIRRADAFMAGSGASDAQRTEASSVYFNISLAYLNMHLYTEAVPIARQSADAVRAVPSSRRRVGTALSLLANALRFQGDLDGAVDAIREARRIVEEASYPDETSRAIEVFGVLARQGMILGEEGTVNAGRPAEAIEPLQTALDLTDAEAQKNPGDSTSRIRVGMSGRALGGILRRTDPLRALFVYDLAAKRLDEVPNSRKARRDQARVLAGSSYALRLLGRPFEAKHRIDEAEQILRNTKDYPAGQIALDSETNVVLCALADYQAAQGEPGRAREVYEQLLGKVVAADADLLNDLPNAVRMSDLYARLAAVYRQTGDSKKAEGIESRRLELWRSWDRRLPLNPYVRRQLDGVNASEQRARAAEGRRPVRAVVAR